MGQVGSKIIRPFRNFNVDNRAAKVLEKRQAVADPAPKHPSTVEKLARLREEHPEFLETQKIRDEKLHENLKHVYVTSKVGQEQTSQRPLPLSRTPPPETDMGSLEPAYSVPEGRVDLKTAMGFLSQYQVDKQNVTPAQIAQEYKLEEKEAQNILTHFKVLQLHIPQEMYKQNKKLKTILSEQMKLPSMISPGARSSGEKKLAGESESSNKDDLTPSKT